MHNVHILKHIYTHILRIYTYREIENDRESGERGKGRGRSRPPLSREPDVGPCNGP